jgi:poly-beta-hydroxyalkanoate depolymerase
MPASPLGKFEWRGRRVDARDPTHCALHRRGASATLFAALARHWLRKNCAAASGPQTGVGHFEVFAGRRWSSYYPILRNVIYASN